MRLTIENKPKLEVFVSIFQLLKNWSSHINMHFEKDKLYIQSMDNSHICLADIEISCTWFSSFDCPTSNTVSVDSSQFALLINYALKNDKLELKYEDEHEPDILYINFLNDKEYNHFFELKLIDVDEDSLGIPEVEYDVDFNIDSKKLSEVLSELNAFSQDLNIICKEEVIELNASGDAAKLKVNIPTDELNEYAITEDKQMNVSFSLNHLRKMCLSTKLSSTTHIFISDDYPMSLVYIIGDNSKVSFYIAPKIADN